MKIYFEFLKHLFNYIFYNIKETKKVSVLYITKLNFTYNITKCKTFKYTNMS